MEIGRATLPDAGAVRPYCLIFAGSVLAMAWQFIFPGYYHMFALDAAMLPKYVSEFNESFRQGILYPRWMANDFWGYGSPVFVLYSPLLYFVCSILSLSGLGLVFIIAVIKFVSVFVGAVFLYHFMKGRFGDRAALAGALFYTFLPTRIFDLYMQNTPAGRFGETFLPMCIFFAGKLVDTGSARAASRWVWYTGLVLSFSGLILSHLASAYMFLPLLVGCGVACRRGVTVPQAVFRLSAGLVLGMLLSSFFFVPVLLERGLVHMEYLKTREIYQYWRHFVFAGHYQRNNPVLDTVYGLLGGSILLEVFILSVLVYFLRAGAGFRLGRETGFFVLASMLCLFMMSWLSAPLWERISSLRLLIFSSRFDVYYMVFVSVLFGIAFDRLYNWKPRPRRINIFVFIGALGLLLYGGNIIRLAHISSDEYTRSITSISDFQQEYLPTTVSLDSLNSAEPHAPGTLGPEDPLFSADGPFKAVVGEWGYIDRAFTLESPRGARLRVKTFYFPGWKAWVDGKEVPLTAQERTGAILMDVPPGRHEVALKFTDTPPRKTGKIISLLTLAGLLIMYFLSDAKESTKESDDFKL